MVRTTSQSALDLVQRDLPIGFKNIGPRSRRLWTLKTRGASLFADLDPEVGQSRLLSDRAFGPITTVN